MIIITIEQVETVWEKSRNWQRLHDGPSTEGQYGYVDAELPQVRTTVLLQQTLSNDALDIGNVIKAINKL